MVVNYLHKKQISPLECETGTLGLFYPSGDKELTFLGAVFRDIDEDNVILVDLEADTYYTDVENYILAEEKNFEFFEK